MNLGDIKLSHPSPVAGIVSEQDAASPRGGSDTQRDDIALRIADAR